MAEPTIELVLQPDQVQHEALTAYLARYLDAASWTARKIIESGITDQVRLHRLLYGDLRAHFDLPAQSAVLCIKHMARQCRSAIGLPQLSPDGPVPYDRHLYSMKAVDALSLATLSGRVVVPCTFAAYRTGPLVAGEAELSRQEGTWVFTVRAALSDSNLRDSQQAKEPTMSDKLLTRISRLVSGVAHNALAQAEDAAAIPVMEQAVRDIDDAVKDVRSEIGQAEATKFNVSRRIAELNSEHEALNEKIATAISESREDLAEAGTGRQLDIENQLTVLQHSLDEADADISKLTDSLNALQASRREAKQRVRDLKAAAQSPAASAAGDAPNGRTATGKAARAIESVEQLSERFTGVPADQSNISHKDLDELAELHRQHEIRERLARYKARLKEPE